MADRYLIIVHDPASADIDRRRQGVEDPGRISLGHLHQHPVVLRALVARHPDDELEGRHRQPRRRPDEAVCGQMRVGDPISRVLHDGSEDALPDRRIRLLPHIVEGQGEDPLLLDRGADDGPVLEDLPYLQSPRTDDGLGGLLDGGLFFLLYVIGDGDVRFVFSVLHLVEAHPTGCYLLTGDIRRNEDPGDPELPHHRALEISGIAHLPTG